MAGAVRAIVLSPRGRLEALLFISPGFCLLFWAADPAGAARKELITYAAMSLLLFTNGHTRRDPMVVTWRVAPVCVRRKRTHRERDDDPDVSVHGVRSALRAGRATDLKEIAGDWRDVVYLACVQTPGTPFRFSGISRRWMFAARLAGSRARYESLLRRCHPRHRSEQPQKPFDFCCVAGP